MFFLTEDLDEHGEDFDVHVHFFAHWEPSFASNRYKGYIGIIDIPGGDLKICNERKPFRKRIIDDYWFKQSGSLNRVLMT